MNFGEMRFLLDKSSIEERYRSFRKENKTGDVAAALLTLAEVMKERNAVLWDFDHQITMGIRQGLYGNNSGESKSLADSIDEVAQAIEGSYTEYESLGEYAERIKAEKEKSKRDNDFSALFEELFELDEESILPAELFNLTLERKNMPATGKQASEFRAFLQRKYGDSIKFAKFGPKDKRYRGVKGISLKNSLN